MDKSYLRQAELVVRCLPSIAVESCFALKGGTALNLFELDLPRLSVDIDLTFLPVTGRDWRSEWKRRNLETLLTRDPKRFAENTEVLERVFGG